MKSHAREYLHRLVDRTDLSLEEAEKKFKFAYRIAKVIEKDDLVCRQDLGYQGLWSNCSPNISEKMDNLYLTLGLNEEPFLFFNSFFFNLLINKFHDRTLTEAEFNFINKYKCRKYSSKSPI